MLAKYNNNYFPVTPKINHSLNSFLLQEIRLHQKGVLWYKGASLPLVDTLAPGTLLFYFSRWNSPGNLLASRFFQEIKGKRNFKEHCHGDIIALLSIFTDKKCYWKTKSGKKIWLLAGRASKCDITNLRWYLQGSDSELEQIGHLFQSISMLRIRT